MEPCRLAVSAGHDARDGTDETGNHLGIPCTSGWIELSDREGPKAFVSGCHLESHRSLLQRRPTVATIGTLSERHVNEVQHIHVDMHRQRSFGQVPQRSHDGCGRIV